VFREKKVRRAKQALKEFKALQAQQVLEVQQ
jgi:hypothetical protein